MIFHWRDKRCLVRRILLSFQAIHDTPEDAPAVLPHSLVGRRWVLRVTLESELIPESESGETEGKDTGDAAAGGSLTPSR